MAAGKASRKGARDDFKNSSKSKARGGTRRAAPAPRHILIAGSGIAGLTLALALARACPAQLTITVCDPTLPAQDLPDARADDARAYAIAAAGRRMFESLGIWPKVAGMAQPMRDMVITDSHLADPVRPSFLNFDGEVEPGEAFAHMVPAHDLLAALLPACREAGVDLRRVAVRRFEADADGGTAHLSDGERLPVTLCVAADGARSRLREAAGIGWVGWSYPQVGIVATIGHERDHMGRAIEHFLPSGPFALLPLTPGGSLGHRSSIVWTERRATASTLLARDPGEVLEEVERRFGLELGAIALETPLRAFPLSFGIAREFAATRLALIGDAAHVIHPIAGQGLNLGLKNVAALAECIVDATRLGMDPGEGDILRDYTRARRFDTVAMAAVTDGLNRLFSNDIEPVRMLRDFGLGLVERLPPLKRFFIREASGLSAKAPRLMRGERL
ncbi:MAG: ubiquinone biosynthesis hydroxylase [Salinarimonas sp.]|nr:ubiquinone biosynthesis hydroxylase [Salinarimonas sp.]